MDKEKILESITV